MGRGSHGAEAIGSMGTWEGTVMGGKESLGQGCENQEDEEAGASARGSAEETCLRTEAFCFSIDSCMAWRGSRFWAWMGTIRRNVASLTEVLSDKGICV